MAKNKNTVKDLINQIGVSTSKTDKITVKDLYRSMGLHPSQIGDRGAKADTSWKTNMLKPLPKKQYGGTYDDKLKNVFGGDTSAAKDFERFMNYRSANETITTQKANDAQNKWQNSFNTNQEKQRAAELAVQKKQKQQKKQGVKLLPKLNQQTKKDLIPKPKEKYTGFNKYFLGPQEWLYDHTLGPVNDFVDRMAASGTNFLTGGQFKKHINSDAAKKSLGPAAQKFAADLSAKPKNKSEHAADFAGELYASAPAFLGLGKLINPGTQAVTNTIMNGGKIDQFLSALAATKGIDAATAMNLMLRGGATMGTLSAGQQFLDEAVNPNDATLTQRTQTVALNAGLGAAGDAGLHGLGVALKDGGAALNKGIEKATGNTMKKMLPTKQEIEKAMNDLAKQHNAENALPIVKNKVPSFEDLLPPIKPKSIPKPEIPKIGKSVELPPVTDEGLSLSERLNMVGKSDRTLPDMSHGKPVIAPPEPDVNVYGVEVPKGDLIDSAPPEYWQNRYEEFVKHVKDNGYNASNLNQEAISELWTHFAKPDEPALNTVIDLAYKGYKEPTVLDAAQVWDKMGSRETASKQAQKILFGNTKTKELPSLIPNPTKQQTKSLVNLIEGLEPLNKPSSPIEPVVNPGEQNISRVMLSNLKELQSNRAGQPNVLPPLKSLGESLKGNSKSLESPSLPNTPSRLSELTPDGLKERQHIQTLRESPNSTESLADRIKGMYRPTTNEAAVTIANKYLAQGAEKAVSFVKSAKDLKPEHVATAHRLIQEFQRTGQIDKAVDIAEYIAEQGTKAGQAVQAFSIFDRLSPEGILVHANRVADRVNSKLNPLQQKVVITNETATQLTDLATTVQKMTQQKTVAIDVMKLMEKAKAGEKLTDTETKQIRQFVDDSKQWIKDISPKKGSPKKNLNKLIKPEVKEQVVSFLDKQEEAARRRLAARKGRALSGLPVDDFYDYAVIGASKLAKGTINFAEFSEQMVREFGQEVAPHIRQIYDKASEMVGNEVQRTVNRLSEVQKITNKAIKNGKLEDAEAEMLRKFAISINDMSGNAKIEASQELQAILQALERPSLMQKVSTAQTIGQLLNPKTLVRNAIGNEIFYRAERIKKIFVSTPIDWATVSVFGGERSATFRTNNQAQYWNNWLRGWKAGLKGVNPEGLSSQYDLRPSSFNSKWDPLMYMERVLGASLKSFDYAGYKRGVNNTIGELATLRAMNEGLKGQARKDAIQRYIRDVDDNVLAIADEYGKYVTFQDNNVVSMSLQKFKSGLNKLTTGSKDFGAGDLIIKYPKTPGALLVRALEYSPAGFLKTAYAIAKPFFNKSASKGEIIESFSRALFGSGMVGMAWFLADKGILTGAGSKDFDIADLESSQGKRNYSVNIDALKRWALNGFDSKSAELQEGDRFISYDWAQPISMSIAMSSNASQNAKINGSPGIGEAVWDTGNGALDSLVGMSVLQGVKQASTSYPGQTTGDKFMSVAGQLPASFIPTFANQIRQKMDNTARNVYDPLKLNQFKNQAKNKLPVLESTLPAGYDTLGNKKEVYKGGSNSFFNVFLNPAFVSRYDPSPEAKMVIDVINDTGDTSVAPRKAQKYFKIDGKTHRLSPEQYAEYQELLGTVVKTQLQELSKIQNDYSSADLGEIINRILDKSGRQVREFLKQRYFGDESK